MRITVVGINYTPEVTGIAPYTTGFAEGMARAGHQVEVVTAPPHYPEWRIAPGYRNAATPPTLLEGVSVRRVRVHMAATPSPRARVLLETSFAQAAVRAKWNRPDLVVTVSPTLISAAAVLAKAKLKRVPCGVIVQDLYSRGVVETGAMTGPLARGAALFEGSVLGAASGVSVIHDRFVDNVVGLGVDRAKVTVIRNWTHIGDANEDASGESRDDVRAAFGWRPDEIVAVHTGNMGAKQGLENVVEAARCAGRPDDTKPPVRFVLVGDGNQRRQLEDLARGVAHLEIRDPLPAGQFRQVLDAADVLLVNEKPGVGEMAVPSKLTSYFVSGRPVVAATDPGSGSACEIELSGGGRLVPAGDPAALLSTVRQIGCDRSLAERMGAAGQAFAASTLSAAAAMHRYERWCHSLLGR